MVAQALLPNDYTSDGELAFSTRLQLYVDDTIVTLLGALGVVVLAFDLLLLLWLCLGAPIAWKKVWLGPTYADTPHRCIGVDFVLRSDGAVMSLPEAFLQDLDGLLVEFARGYSTVGDQIADR